MHIMLQRPRNYGVPYMGSKNKICEKLLWAFPDGFENFYDLFAGGCAVTHAALLSGKFENVYTNDIGDAPKLFLDSVNGMYENETRWISRETFFAEKDTDPYVRLCWSFGNDQKTYMYSVEVEPWKKALHYARANGDLSLFKSYGINTDGTRRDIAKHQEEYKHQYVKWYLSKVPESSVTEHTIAALSQLQALQGLQNLQRLNRLKELSKLKRKESLKISMGDYRDVSIRPNSIIYCDIPYRNTAEYCVKFDHEAFYDWVEAQTEMVLISEYSMPEDRFECVWSTKHRSRFSSTANNEVIEKLFCPKKQVEWYRELTYRPTYKQLELF